MVVELDISTELGVTFGLLSIGPALPGAGPVDYSGQRYCLHHTMVSFKLGQPLNLGEVVHHVNGDPADHHLHNPSVCSSQRAFSTTTRGAES